MSIDIYKRRLDILPGFPFFSFGRRRGSGDGDVSDCILVQTTYLSALGAGELLWSILISLLVILS